MSDNNTLSVFSYIGNDVRVVTIDGNPWWVASDIAAILDSRAATGITRMIDDDDKGFHKVETPGGLQSLVVINESGLWTALLRSNNPNAKPLRRWVTAIVLPEIRSTGSYMALGSLRVPAVPESFAEALELAAAKVREVESLEAQIAVDAPKVGYVDTFVADGDLRLLRNVAKSIGLQESVLREELIARKWIYQETTTRWSASQQKKVEVHRYSPYSDKREYFDTRPDHQAPRFKGEVMHTLKVTPAGALAIARNFSPVPVSEIAARLDEAMYTTSQVSS